MATNTQKQIIVVGCGRLGSSLAGLLGDQGYGVTAIDKNEDSFRKLPKSFSGFEIAADASDIDVLIRANIASAEMVIVTTDSDNTNSLIAQIASRLYMVPNVYMRLNDSEKEKLVEDYNIQVICPFKLSLEEFGRLSAVDLTGVSL